jgi:hypothetical protein
MHIKAKIDLTAAQAIRWLPDAGNIKPPAKQCMMSKPEGCPVEAKVHSCTCNIVTIKQIFKATTEQG